jgi:hypothetical protein
MFTRSRICITAYNKSFEKLYLRRKHKTLIPDPIFFNIWGEKIST